MRRLAEQEGGGVLVLTALWMPVVVLFASFVIDGANWFEHRRHLQLQADAGAYAGGSLFSGCFNNTTAADGAITSFAKRYAGDPGSSGAYNLQVGGSRKGTVTVRINRKTYEVGGLADDTVESGPCEAKMVDVKLTEADLPWFMAGNFVRAINAHARVEFQQKGTSSDSLPVGVPDSNPLAAAAIYVDESNNNAVLATQTLNNTNTTQSWNGETLTKWTSGLPVSVNIAHPNIGIVIALAGKTGWTPPPGGLGAICSDALVECYSVSLDANGAVTSATGIDFIRGWTTTPAGTALAPVARDVSLYNAGCTDNSGPYFLLHGNCTIGVKAKVDFGTGTVNPTLAPVSAQLKVSNNVAGCPNAGQAPKGCNMVYNATGANAGYWTTDGSNAYPTMPNDDGLGHVIDLNWGTGTGRAAVNGTITGVQRSFSANTDTSGPVHYIRVDENLADGTSVTFANSLLFGSHNLSVTIGIKPSLQVNQSSPTAPAVALKVVNTGSNGQALDCDPSKAQLRDQLAYGCSPQYVLNGGSPCQSNVYYSTLPQTAPWDCSLTKPGGTVGAVDDGMLCRTQGVCFSGSRSCANPNNWRDANGDGKVTVPEDIAPSDPRLISVFVVPYGALSQQGRHAVPIINFASFYITGWSRQGGGGISQGDPCPNSDALPNSKSGWIVGHFIKYVDTIGGTGTGSACDPNSFGTCVAVLTR